MRSEAAPRSPRPAAALLGTRGRVLAAIALLGLGSCLFLRLAPADLWPRPGGVALLRDFLSSALHPTLARERPLAGAPTITRELLAATLRTLCFALAATSLALFAALPLAVVSSDAFWRGLATGRLAPLARAAQVAARVAIALLRSVHELLWAVVFLAALGLNTAAAVVALALPFAGTLAKVVSEMLDETPPGAEDALRALGARSTLAFLVGRVPFAAPDAAAYAFYRFECAVRSSAVLGFFGYRTLGYHLELAFRDTRFREAWTYLYAMIALVLVFEAWSAALRRRAVA